MDQELVKCVVCKGSFKKRGLKIHQKKSGCYKELTDPHRKSCKSVAPNIRETNHSDVGHQVDQEERAAETKVGEERRTEEKVPRQIEEANTEEKHIEVSQESGEGGDGKGNSEELEIHVDASLYDEVDSWLVKTVIDVKEEISNKKKGQDIRGWFSTENKTTSVAPRKPDSKPTRAPATKGRQEKNAKAKSESRMVIAEQQQGARSVEEKRKGHGMRCKENGEDTRRVILREQGIGSSVETETEAKMEQKVGRNKILVKDSRRIVLQEKQDIRGWFKPEKETSKPRTCFEEKEEQIKDTRKVIKTTDLGQVNIRQGPAKEVLAKHGLHLTRGDFRSLSGRNYLNDKIIEEYLRLISARNEEDSQLPSVHVCSVFLYKQLSKFGLEEGCRRTRNWIKEDITTKDMVVFPIHSGEHWTLIVVEPHKKTVQYLDSLKVSRNFSSAPRVIKAFMERRHREKGEESEYRIKIRENIPQQTNGVDCGVFACQYAERITRGAVMDFQQRDMTEARKTMTLELLEGKLKPPEQRRQVQTEEKEKKTERKQKSERKREEKESHKVEGKEEKDVSGESSIFQITVHFQIVRCCTEYCYK